MNKERGEQAEAIFLAKALSEGFVVCKPWGDNQSYDFILEYRGRLCKVQVKSCTYFRKSSKGGNYYLYLKKGGAKGSKAYTLQDTDFIAIFVENVFYIIPTKELKAQSIKLYPHRINLDGYYEHFREEWHLLK